jgi:hypothetical protein
VERVGRVDLAAEPPGPIVAVSPIGPPPIRLTAATPNSRPPIVAVPSGEVASSDRHVGQIIASV